MSDSLKYPGLDDCFDSVVDKHGREMFALVMQAGLGSAATEQLNQLAGTLAGGSAISRRNSFVILQAMRVLAGAVNELGNELIKAKGWSAEEIEACNTALEQAWAGKLSVVEAGKVQVH